MTPGVQRNHEPHTGNVPDTGCVHGGSSCLACPLPACYYDTAHGGHYDQQDHRPDCGCVACTVRKKKGGLE